MRRESGGGDLVIPDFENTNRVTVMAAVSAAGDVGPVLFVFKGTCLPWRKVDRNGDHVVEKISTFLTSNSLACVLRWQA